ncbi:InlB B-repeat-containing protein [Algoriphagus boritolerans]|uniref:InlB B-repeat-containing protein n=1 Tax=Algoriphagus boritolerans TaxID=308111 RepID=UPI002FCE5AD6
MPTYTLTLSASPVAGGKITVFPQSPNYKEGDLVTLTPEPNEHWVFKQWEGDGTGNSTPLSVVMNSNKLIVGVFIKREYPLNLKIEGEGTVEEKIVTNPSGREYPHGTIVELTPKPKEGWVFDSWSGDLSGSESPKTVTVEKEKNVTARFKEIPKFYLHPNGVTCMCPNTKPGDKGIINGIEYESVDNTLLSQRLRDGVDWSKLCTSLVTDMSRLFYNWDIYGCFENWDVSKVINMNEMFYQAFFF